MHTVATPQTRFTPDDVLSLENEGLFELVDGQLREKLMSSLATETAANISCELVLYRRLNRAGSAYNEQSFQCFPRDPDMVRRPDVAFIVGDRLADVAKEGHIKIVPDLAVEVVSPNDKAYEVEQKLEDYRLAGIRLIWFVYPASRRIYVYPLGEPAIELRENDTLTGGSVLPGFSVAVRNLFTT